MTPEQPSEAAAFGKVLIPARTRRQGPSRDEMGTSDWTVGTDAPTGVGHTSNLPGI